MPFFQRYKPLDELCVNNEILVKHANESIGLFGAVLESQHQFVMAFTPSNATWQIEEEWGGYLVVVEPLVLCYLVFIVFSGEN